MVSGKVQQPRSANYQTEAIGGLHAPGVYWVKWASVPSFVPLSIT